MPKYKDLGYGPFTPDKVSAFRSILQMHQVIARAVINRTKATLPYLYLDLTAGPGYADPQQNLPGSPLIFLQLATQSLRIGRSDKFMKPVPFEAHFFEYDREFAESLKARVQPYRKSPYCTGIKVHSADYTDPTKGVLALISEFGYQPYRYGLVYIDPSGNLPDFDVLAQIAEHLPRVEVLLHIPAAIIKRLRNREDHEHNEYLTDLLEKIPKSLWLVRDVKPGDKHQWTFLMGTNARASNGDELFRGLTQERFFPISDKRGREILEYLNLTKKEWKTQKHPRLPFPDFDLS